METNKKLNYFDMAENDYHYFYHDYTSGRVGNPLCYAAQNICERYLKHVVELACADIDTTVILKTHSIQVLRNFIRANIPEFRCSWNIILPVNGYYFSARYPGDDSLIATADDVEDCWQAVEETRRAVLEFIESYSPGKMEDITLDSEVTQALKGFE